MNKPIQKRQTQSSRMCSWNCSQMMRKRRRPETSAATEQEAETANGETVSTDPMQQARSMYTGISGEPQEVTSTTDMFQQIQDMANVITNAVVGATLTVDFAEGEQREIYRHRRYRQRRGGDGIRYFYLMLAEPPTEPPRTALRQAVP